MAVLNRTTGVYILQNTMVVGEWLLLGKKMKTEGVGEKMKKGKRSFDKRSLNSY